MFRNTFPISPNPHPDRLGESSGRRAPVNLPSSVRRFVVTFRADCLRNRRYEYIISIEELPELRGNYS
jgi:hypothetical protein